MPSREELIEDAARAINNVRWNLALPHANPNGATWTDKDLARAALAVFEKAHAPTDAATEVTPELEVEGDAPSGVAQGEPSDAPTVHFMARQGGKSQALVDQMLAQANERGVRVEVVYPQGEPSDVALLAAANAYMHYKPPYDDLSAFSAEFLDDMRAALRAAYKARGEGR
ncbi:hypothetical protein [Microbacterium aerolatum]|uniref:hypothetical protein n=1 Tax=Microbacterium aerolatum TaxID=153731 RepID=UPI003851166C